MDLADTLDSTFQHTHRVSLRAVQPEQYLDPTPCTEWTVRDLMEHMIAVVAGLGSAAAGTPPSAFELGADPAAQFDDVSRRALEAWRTDGVMERVLEGGPGPMPGHVLAGINLLDTATHSWDLATATGQDPTLPEDVAVAALDAGKTIISPEIRPGRFAPEVAPSPGAGPTAQLAAFLGRTP